MIFWVSFLMFNFSYLFRVLFLAFLVMVIILVYIRGIIFLKYLVVLIYIRGIIVSILYISCLCWLVRGKLGKRFMILGLIIVFFFDFGIVRKFSDVGEYIWIYLFFRFLFNSLIMGYSLSLFKVSGSLRF